MSSFVYRKIPVGQVNDLISLCESKFIEWSIWNPEEMAEDDTTHVEFGVYPQDTGIFDELGILYAE